MKAYPRRPSQVAELERWRCQRPAASAPHRAAEPSFWSDVLSIALIVGFGLAALWLGGG